MKKIRITALGLILAILTLVISPGLAVAQPDGTGELLTIEEALEIAFRSNPSYRMADLQLEKAEIIKDKAAQALGWVRGPQPGVVDPTYYETLTAYEQAITGYNAARKSLEAQKNVLTKDVITAYTNCLIEYNNLAYARTNLKNTQRLQQISGIARTVGMMGNYEFDKVDAGLKQLQEAVKAQEAAYEGALASLRAILGKDKGWTPNLTSKPVLATYPRHSLETELSRGVEESILLLEKKTNYEINKSQQHWILPTDIPGVKNIDLELSEKEYEQAKRDTRATIESLYLAIDALEAQIEAAQKAYQLANKDLEVVQLKYELGMIPEYSLLPTGESLASAKAAYEKAQIDLENLQAKLAVTKAQFATLTGQEAYDSADWAEVRASDVTSCCYQIE